MSVGLFIYFEFNWKRFRKFQFEEKDCVLFLFDYSFFNSLTLHTHTHTRARTHARTYARTHARTQVECFKRGVSLFLNHLQYRLCSFIWDRMEPWCSCICLVHHIDKHRYQWYPNQDLTDWLRLISLNCMSIMIEINVSENDDWIYFQGTLNSGIYPDLRSSKDTAIELNQSHICQ